MSPTPVILDVDPGHDDAVAIMLARGAPELELLAVTTVAGNAPLEKTTRNALRVLSLIGHPDVPVAAGASSPLLTVSLPRLITSGPDFLASHTGLSAPFPQAGGSSLHRTRISSLRLQVLY